MSELVHPKERLYFVLISLVSIGLWLLFGLQLYFAFSAGDAESLAGLSIVVFYAVLLLIGSFTVQGLYIGYVRTNAVRVSPRQFPEVHRLAVSLCEQMQIQTVPDIYIQESAGALNALATRFLGRNCVVLYADILEIAYQQGEEEVGFVVAHELAHIKRNHLIGRWFFLPAWLVPFLWPAYSRACEYTCDRLAAAMRPKGAIRGLQLLAAGKHLYPKVDPEEFAEQAQGGFWGWLAEISSTHPHLSKRMNVLLRGGTDRPVARPLRPSDLLRDNPAS